MHSSVPLHDFHKEDTLPKDSLLSLSLLTAPFSQRIIMARSQALDQAMNSDPSPLIQPYQDGVKLVFTEKTLALVFHTIPYDGTYAFNKLYAPDFDVIQKICQNLVTRGQPIRAFCFDGVLGRVRLQSDRESCATTLEQLHLLLKQYGPSLLSFNLSHNQLTDNEVADALHALQSVQSPLLREINLSGNTLGYYAIENLSKYLREAPLLRELEIEHCELNDELFQTVLAALPQIQKINVNDNHLSGQTEAFLRKNLYLPYLPVYDAKNWKNPCQELLDISLENNSLGPLFTQGLPALLITRKQQAHQWREQCLFFSEAKREAVFTAVREGEISWLEALVFEQDDGVHTYSTDGFPFKNYGHEINLIEIHKVVLRTRHLEAIEHSELLEDQQNLLMDYVSRKEVRIKGEEYIQIANISALKKALEDRFAIYQKEKLDRPLEEDEHDVLLKDELVQVKKVMRKETQEEILKSYQVPTFETINDVQSLIVTFKNQKIALETKLEQYQAQEDYYHRRYNELISQRKRKARVWELSNIQGKLPLIWNRQLTNEDECHERLLNHPFDPNIVDKKNGLSLLHLAIQYNQLEVFKLLLKAGANITTRDRNGKSVIESAYELEDKKLRVSYLRAIVEHMKEKKISNDNNHLDPLYWLSYGEEAQTLLNIILANYQGYGQEMLKRQTLDGVKGFLYQLKSRSAISLQFNRNHELAQYWESFWKQASKGELRCLIHEGKKIAQNAKYGLFGLSKSILHGKSQGSLKQLEIVLDKNPQTEASVHKAMQEKGVMEERYNQVSRDCRNLAKQQEREEKFCQVDLMLSKQRRMDTEKNEIEQENANLQIKELQRENSEKGKQIEELKTNKSESDKKFEAYKSESDKRLAALETALSELKKAPHEKSEGSESNAEEKSKTSKQGFFKKEKEKKKIKTRLVSVSEEEEEKEEEIPLAATKSTAKIERQPLFNKRN